MYICNEEIVVKTDDFTFSHVSMLYENTYKTKNRSRTVSGVFLVICFVGFLDDFSLHFLNISVFIIYAMLFIKTLLQSL